MSTIVKNTEEKDDKSVESTDVSDNESEYEEKNDHEVADEDEDEDEDEIEDEDELEEVENYNDEVDFQEIENVQGDREDVDINDLEEEEEQSFQKIEDYTVLSDLEKLHPECQNVNYHEVAALTRVVRNNKGNIVDPLHKTVPFLTKYEKARIIGVRTEQLERGAQPLIPLAANIINGRTIAMMEFEKKKIPFIIARPIPNKAIEYWKLEDLEFL
jgi:DNA-directed RNA polymerase subunit K/omega